MTDLTAFDLTYKIGRRTLTFTRFHYNLDLAKAFADCLAVDMQLDYRARVSLVSVTPAAIDPRQPACTCGDDHDCRSTGCDDECPACN